MASVPPQSSANDDGRLPWLADVASPPVAAGPAPRADRPGLRWLAVLVIGVLIAAGAFLLGRKSEVIPVATVEAPLASTPLAPARPAAPLPLTSPAPATSPPALARAEAATSRGRAAEPVLHLRAEQVRAVRSIARQAKIAVHRNSVPHAVRQAYSPRIAAPGRVVQLGAYRSVAEAEDAAQRFRYKYRGLLAPLPKAVLPFRPKNARRMFYRVQFVTPSQAYAEVTCQRLRAAAKTCIVVY
ncbi:MAG: SPOR domain-containing protein [Sphingomicrobium sp.]